MSKAKYLYYKVQQQGTTCVAAKLSGNDIPLSGILANEFELKVWVVGHF